MPRERKKCTKEELEKLVGSGAKSMCVMKKELNCTPCQGHFELV